MAPRSADEVADEERCAIELDSLSSERHDSKDGGPSRVKPGAVDEATRVATDHFRDHAARFPLLPIHRALYFVFMAAEAAYFPFVGVYCLSVGLSLPETGVILALAPICSVVASPFWGALSDRGHRRAIFVGCLGVSTALRLLVPLLPAGSFWPLAVLVTLAELIGAPILPILDASTLAALDATIGIGRYGGVRAFGALGWGLMAPVAGMIMDASGSTAAMFVILGVGTIPALALAALLPLERRTANGGSARVALARLCTPEAALFFASAFISGCVGAGVIGSFLFPWLRTLGASRLLLGLSLSFTCERVLWRLCAPCWPCCDRVHHHTSLLRRRKRNPLLLCGRLRCQAGGVLCCPSYLQCVGLGGARQRVVPLKCSARLHPPPPSACLCCARHALHGSDRPVVGAPH